MAFPSPSLVAPALAPYEISYDGLTFGGINPAKPYNLRTLQIDMPDVATGDMQRAIDQGEFPGVDVLPGADLTIEQTVTADDVSLDNAAQALGGVFGPGGTTEIPLWYQLPTGCFCRLCRPRKHNCPTDINRVFARVAIATTLLHSTDPRWYAAPSAQQTVALPAAIGGGLAFPAPVPWMFGSGSAGGLLNVVNSGLFESRPVLIITGPCANPQVSNVSLSGAPAIGVNLTLAPGDTLVIDTNWQTVVYTTAGSTIGSPRRDALTSDAIWWNLPKQSSNVIRFSSADPEPVTGTLTVQSASAYLSL